MTIFARTRDQAGPSGGRLPAHPCGSGGFSLPELLIVLVVIGIMSAFVLPRIEILRYRLDGSVRGFATALVMAQRAAVNRQHDVVVAFDTANGRLRIHEDADNDGVMEDGERVRYVRLDEGVRFGLGSAPTRNGMTEPVTFSDTQEGLPAVRFHRSGSASTQGAFYLTSDRSIGDARYAEDSRAVEVERSTGRAAWFAYESTGWEQGS